MNDDTFSLDQFSTELIVECMLQHLETSIPQRHYNGIHNTESLKKWIRLTETLVQSLRNDLKSCKVIATAPIDRKKASKIICLWTPDMKTLKSLYLSSFHSRVKEDRMQKEVDSLYNYLEYLCDMADYVYGRKLEEEEAGQQKKGEVVFIFDDSQSTTTND